MTLYHKLHPPRVEPGIPGIVFPIEFSEAEEPWVTVHSASLVVPGFIAADGTVVIDEAELDRQIDELEARVTAEREPPTVRLPSGLVARIGRPQRRDRRQRRG